MQVHATDPDCGVNAMVNYTLGAGRVASEYLLVRSGTGEICVKSPLDREATASLELPVIATDRGQYFNRTHAILTQPIIINYDNLSVGDYNRAFNDICIAH